MKANHNSIQYDKNGQIVVVNISSSKNESKSQLYPTLTSHNAVGYSAP
ncbi:hypothetical protein SAMN05421813_1131 [Daejeonella rubra]|uniref:Uncharacterized protein n=1 Tax=Daejeonella rubra TaxID=990371 RepID=A0A1G9TF95_9SPHI|nr:hypothetical protein [Daejeonella rubra]SDM46449.1 hypothetical protein SAMN05421813_1131 [Daejeonella rubra]